MTIWQEFNKLLPLAKAGAEKPLLPLRTAYITALEKVLDSCATWFAKVNCLFFIAVPLLHLYCWGGAFRGCFLIFFWLTNQLLKVKVKSTYLL